MTPLAVDQAVALYVAARHRRQRIAVLPGDCRPATLDEAYSVQAVLNQRLGDTHGAVCGRKIGCTTPVMQRYLGRSPIPAPALSTSSGRTQRPRRWPMPTTGGRASSARSR